MNKVVNPLIDWLDQKSDIENQEICILRINGVLFARALSNELFDMLDFNLMYQTDLDSVEVLDDGDLELNCTYKGGGWKNE